ncbi:Pyruvate phosphate dikinase PEP/pyruvate-binding protein [Syntrophobacter sp. SbD1]|nr:Pyruvate phosphate dikinase PEP/pyruvate-binding protein [Syntrophobacter sp. SbD1]
MNVIDGLRKVFSFWSPTKPSLPFSVLFKKFRSILERNNRILELMADMGDKLGGEYVFDRQYVLDISENIGDLVFKLISDLCVMTQTENVDLFISFERIQNDIQEELAGRRAFPMIRPAVLLDELNGDLNEEVGNKFANIGDIRNTLGLPTMDGFAITTRAFFDFMKANGLLKHIETSLAAVDLKDETAFEAMCDDVRTRILKGTIPRHVVSSINAMLDVVKGRAEVRYPRFAVRSSAWGEDSEFSFAGQYESVLNVPGNGIAEAYRRVIASAYTPEAWRYRLHRGFRESEMAMAVGCQLMVDAEVSGAMYTYAPLPLEKEAMMISAAWGLGPAVVSGLAESDTFVLDRMPPHNILSNESGHKVSKMVMDLNGGTAWREVPGHLQDKPCLSDEYIQRLAQAAIMIERYYRRPQDVEWAFDSKGNLYILQSRPLNVRPNQPDRHRLYIDHASLSAQVLFSGKGTVVQGGVASGKVYVARADDDLNDFPYGAILVARYTSPKYSKIMRKARGILTDIGSATGHMATLAREYRVPTVVDTGVATKVLKTGDEVTLDAIQNVVYEGTVNELSQFEITQEEVFEESYEYRLLKRILKKVNPLNLVDPHSESFKAARCLTFHDITRFVHEKAVERLIDLSENYQNYHDRTPKRLDCDIPLGLVIIDIDKGTSALPEARSMTVEQIESAPMKAMLQGLSESGMWETTPVAVDMGSMMSSFTRTFSSSLAGPEDVGRNLAVISNNYMNLHLRLGYHFTILDAYIGDELNDNYIYFRFLGGVSDLQRRSRRARFIAEVMECYDFRVEVHGDLIVGRLKKMSRDRMVSRMKVLGGLIGYTRQLDISMISDERIGQHVAEFMHRIDVLTEVGDDVPMCRLPATKDADSYTR